MANINLSENVKYETTLTQNDNILKKINNCIKNCEPYKQNMTRMFQCVNTCENTIRKEYNISSTLTVKKL